MSPETGTVLVVYAIVWAVAIAGGFVWMGLALGALLRKVGGTPAHAWVPVLRWVAAARAARMSVIPVIIARSVALVGALAYVVGVAVLASTSPDFPPIARGLLVGGALAALLGSLVGWVLWIYGSGMIELRLRAPAALSWLAAVSPVIWASVMGWGKYGVVPDTGVTADARTGDSGPAPAAAAGGGGTAASAGDAPIAPDRAMSAATAPLPSRASRPPRYGAGAWASAQSAPSAPSAPAPAPGAAESADVPEAEYTVVPSAPSAPGTEPTWAAVNSSAPVTPSIAPQRQVPEPPMSEPQLPEPLLPEPPRPAAPAPSSQHRDQHAAAEPTPATAPISALPPGWGTPAAAPAPMTPQPSAPEPELPPLADPAAGAGAASPEYPAPSTPPASATPAPAAPATPPASATPATPEPEPYSGPVSPYLQAAGASTPAPRPHAPSAEQPAHEASVEREPSPASAVDSDALPAPQSAPHDAPLPEPLPWAATPAPEPASAPEPPSIPTSEPDTWEPWAAGAPLAPPPIPVSPDEDDRTVIAQRRKDSWALEVVGGGRYPLTEGPIVIGRATATHTPGRLGVDDSTRTMSKVHAELTYMGGAWNVRDLGSTNGTYVRIGDDEREVDGTEAIPADATLLLGDLEVRIVADEGDR
ncbi:FHA domain-containing protein [Demequina activiva]|uniref:FHA domain-containing protein n=1 Tax=Demequina activiva TaxID=1582364 RepID=A0A919UJ99_9MICO|nr:FHA domain-containing protein [Demequina activiva]GIG54161.1 hypothetical protein Dac01nite_09130 [Demequina activiva]